MSERLRNNVKKVRMNLADTISYYHQALFTYIAVEYIEKKTGWSQCCMRQFQKYFLK